MPSKRFQELSQELERQHQNEVRNNEQYQQALQHTAQNRGSRTTGASVSSGQTMLQAAKAAMAQRVREQADAGVNLLKSTLPGGTFTTDFRKETSIKAGRNTSNLVAAGTKQNQQTELEKKEKNEKNKINAGMDLLKSTLPGGSLQTDFRVGTSISTGGAQQNRGVELAKTAKRMLGQTQPFSSATVKDEIDAIAPFQTEAQKEQTRESVKQEVIRDSMTDAQWIAYQQSEAEKKREDAANRMNALIGGRTATERAEYQQAKEEYDQWDSEVNSLAAQYYTLVNEETLGKLQSDSGLHETYNSIAELDDQILSLRETKRARSPVAGQSVTDYDLQVQEELDQKIQQAEAQREQAIQALKDAGIDYESAKAYMERIEKEQQSAQQAQEIYDRAKEHKVGTSVESALLSPVQGVDYVYNALKGIGHSDPTDLESYVPYSSADFPVTNRIQGTRAAVSEDMGAVGSFLYNTGLSIIDSTMLGAALGPASLPVSGLRAAADTMKTAVDNGASNNQALAVGTAAGVAEAFFEKFSIDNLLEEKSVGSIKDLAMGFLKQAGVEASEEAATETANILADAVIMGKDSEFQQNVRAYMAQGMDEESARKQAFIAAVKQVGLSGLGGAISGGLVGGSYNTYNYLKSGGSGSQMTSTRVNTPQSVQTAQQTAQSTGEVSSQPTQEIPARGGWGLEKVDITKYSLDTPERAAAESHNYVLGQAGISLNDQGADRILSTTENRQAFERLTGKTIAGDLAQQRQIVKDGILELESQMQGDERGTAAQLDTSHAGNPTEVGYKGDTAAPGFDVSQTGDPVNQDSSSVSDNHGSVTAQASERSALTMIQNIPFNDDAQQQAQNDKTMVALADELISPPDSGGNGNMGTLRGTSGRIGGETKESKFYSNTLKNSEVFGGIFQEVYAELTENDPQSMRYEVASELESMLEAAERVRFDAQGETEQLLAKDPVAFTHVDIDTAMGLIANYQANGQTEEAMALAKQVRKAGTQEGQAIQALAKYTRTGIGTAVKGASILENAQISNAKKVSAGEALMGAGAKIDEAMKMAQSGDEAGSRDTLIQTIRELAKLRNTVGIKGDVSRATDRALSKLSVDDLNGIAMAQMQAAPQDLTTKRSKAEILGALQRDMQLSGIPTIARNLVGNSFFDFVDTMATDLSVPIDIMFSKVTGRRTIGLDPGWFSSAKRSGAAYAYAKSFAEVSLDVNPDSAETRYGTSSNRTFKMTGSALERLLSRFEKNLGYFLTTSDETFKGGTRSQAASATQKFVGPGGITEAEQAQLADAVAAERTFQQDSALSGLASTLKKGMNKVGVQSQAYVKDANGKRYKLDPKGLDIPGYVEQTAQKLGIDPDTVRQALQQRSSEKFGLGNAILNYPKVPANLADLAVDYVSGNPVGAARALYNVFDVVKNSDTISATQQRTAAMRVGRQITGIPMIVALTALAKKGILFVGDALGDDEDDDRTKSMASSGATGTRMNLSAFGRLLRGESTQWEDGDTLFDSSFLQPFDSMMTLAGMIAQEEDRPASDYVNLSLSAVCQSIMDMPAISALMDVFSQIQWGDGEYSGEKFYNAVANTALNTISGFTPAPVRNIAKGLDPAQRDISTSDTRTGQFADSVASNVPGLRNTLPEKTNEMGAGLYGLENGALQFLNENINPGKAYVYRRSDVQQEFDRLYESTGLATQYAGSDAPSSVKVDGETVKLTSEQQKEIKNERGMAYNSLAEEFMNSDFYSILSDDDKVGVYEELYSLAQEIGKRAVVPGYEPSKNLDMLSLYDDSDAAGVAQYAVNKQITSELKNAVESAQDGDASGIEKMDKIYSTFEQLSASDRKALLEQIGGEMDKFVEARRYGISSEQYAQVKSMYDEISDEEEISATQKATEFASALDRETSLTNTQKSVMMEAMAYYSFVRAEPTAYNRMKNAGVSSEDADKIVMTVFQRGASTDAEKYMAINAANGVSDSVRYQAALGLFGENDDSARAKITAAEDYGIPFDTLARYYSAKEYYKTDLGVQVNSKAEYQELINGLGIDDIEVKRALWLVGDLSHKPSTSPYGSSNASWELYNYLQANKAVSPYS